MVFTVTSVVVGSMYLGISLVLCYAAFRNKNLPNKHMHWLFGFSLFFAGISRLIDPFDDGRSPLYILTLTLAATAAVPTMYMTLKSLPEMLSARPLQELIQANARFRLLVESVRDYAIFLLDPNGNIVSWNRGAEHLKGYKSNEILGQHFSVFYTEEDKARNHPREELEVAKSEGRYSEEGWRIKRDGTRFWALVTITAIRADDGRLEGFAKVTRDLSERKFAEDEAKKLNQLLHMRMMALEAFNHSVCHDLNAPVRSIDGFSQVLIEDYTEKVDEPMLNYLIRIRMACDRMKNLVRDLLRLSQVSHEDIKAGRVNFSMTDMVYEIAGQEKLYDGQEKHKVEVQSGMRANGDPGLVRLLIQNLISNAFKFTGKRAEPTIRIGLNEGGEFYVCDNGIGFPQNKADMLFRPFSRLQGASEFPGTGIGLTICKRVIDIHDGTIRGEGKPGEGACFYFTLGKG